MSGFSDNLYYRLSLFTTVGWQSAIFSTVNAVTCGLITYSFFDGNSAKTLGASVVCAASTTLAYALTDTAGLYFFPINIPSNIAQTTITPSPSPSYNHNTDHSNLNTALSDATTSPSPYSSYNFYSASPTLLMGTTATPTPNFHPEPAE